MRSHAGELGPPNALLVTGWTWEVRVGWEVGRVFRTDAPTPGRPGMV